MCNPNKLEFLGNKLLRPSPPSSSSDGAPLPPLPPRCACVGCPVLSVVTVNRVQDTYATPVYDSGEEASLQQLEEMRTAGYSLDVPR